MTQEEKNLLLKDLCARLYYRPTVLLSGKEHCILCGIDGDEVYLNIDSNPFNVESIKPYLRPMSSMTDEEREELKQVALVDNEGVPGDITAYIDWVNKKMFAYRTLHGKDMFELGLALEAPKDMYK